MTRAQQLAATLTSILEGDPWYAFSVMATIFGISAVGAAARLDKAHTIWEIASHLDAWNHVCLRRMAGEAVDEPEVNFSTPENVTPDEWRSILGRLHASCREVIAKANHLTDAELAAQVAGKDYTVDYLIEGIGQHWIYHSGQIAILRRALSA